jgi:hypothetical protein
MAKAAADIRSLARSHTATAVRTLAGIMKESRAPAAARISAAIALLDRGWGKPQQEVEMNLRKKPPREMTDEELMAIIARGQDRMESDA